MTTATTYIIPPKMKFVLLMLPFVAVATANLPPEPLPHLMPPRPSSSHDKQVDAPETLVRRPRNDSSGSEGSKSESDQKSEPHQQEARAILWAAPAISILSSHRGRSSDCNPCDRVPWVPMGRALNTQQYALSIPTIQLTLPVNYGLPIAQMRPPPQYGPPPPQQPSPPSSQSQYGPPPPSSQYGPPLQQSPPPSSQYGPPLQQSPPPSSQYGPPLQQSPPPSSQFGPPLQQSPQPSSQYGPPPQKYGPPQQAPHQYGRLSGPPAQGDAKVNGPPSNQYGPPENEKDGLPPPPLPQRFLSPSKPYGPPQPQTQHTSSSNNNPSTLKFPPPPSGPSLLKHQLLPAIKFGPPFNPNVPPKFSPPPKSPQNQTPANPPPPPPPHSARPIHNGPQQYRGEPIKQTYLVQNPIPFPSLSKSPLPPLYNYQTFNDGKQDQLHPYLQPPKPQNVVVTISETDDSCKKCLEHSQPDSEPAPAEHVSENVIKTTEKYRANALDHQKSSVQVVKSVPLAEYLASVEYPMQIVQAPILDVPDLTKYFDLGYHNFPQVYYQKENKYNLGDQNPSNSFNQPNPVYVNHNLHNPNVTPSIYSSTTGLDNVDFPENQFQTTNSIPHNHKPDINVLGKNQGTTEKGFTSSPFVSTTLSHSTLTTRPSQIFHVNKKPTTHSQPSTLTTSGFSTSQGYSASGHYVTSTPTTEGKISQQLPNTGSPKPFHETRPPSIQDQILSTKPEGQIHSAPSDLRFLDPPPVGSGAISDWTLHSYGRGWGTTPPQPFAVPTPSSHNPRFIVRPTAAPSKKGKLIHQIIVPYTTNKQTHTPTLAQDPPNNLGWTPLPPTSQGRKVPSHTHFENQFPSSTGLDQSHQNFFPSGNFHVTANVPLSASGSDNLASQQIPPSGNGQGINLPPHVINQIPPSGNGQPINLPPHVINQIPPSGNGQPINLPPHVINQILHLNQPGTWPSGPEELQQLLVSNLQGLLRGEEDSVDIARLQKNIDNWTAEGYKQNSPSVNFIPVTPITHIYNSKKIPDEYLTSTEPSITFNSSQQETFGTYRHNFDSDNEGAESQKHQVKVHPDSHSKDGEETEDTTETIESLLNSWSLLDTKVVTPSSTTTEETITQEPYPITDATSKAWEKIQVSISPLTNEKVYVVTPVPAVGAESESTTTVLSTRVERSYSVVTSGAESPSPPGEGAVSNKH